MERSPAVQSTYDKRVSLNIKIVHEDNNRNINILPANDHIILLDEKSRRDSPLKREKLF